VAFRISQDLVEDVIRPSWYGQVRADILFRQKSNYAFNAYLYASLYVVEKDSSRSEFYGPALPLHEWRTVLGVPPETYPYAAHFRAFIFRRTEAQILKTTKGTDTPLEIEWKECTGDTYQMVVKRAPRPVKARLKPDLALAKAQDDEAARRKAEQAALDAKAQDWILQSPHGKALNLECQKRFGKVTHFAVMMLFAEKGISLPPEFR
jgi:hypothetical protein